MRTLRRVCVVPCLTARLTADLSARVVSARAGSVAGTSASDCPSAERFGNCSAGDKRRPRRLHLLLGDANARRAGMASRLHGERFFSLARDGETWISLLDHLDEALVAWRAAAATRGMSAGSAVVWLSGDEVYSGGGGDTDLWDPKSGLLRTVSRVARTAVLRLGQETSEVLVLGPLPRLAGETKTFAQWERTPTFHLERALMKQDMGQCARFVPLGRSLTCKMGRRHSMNPRCSVWFERDGIRLSAEGYCKVAACLAFPAWLQLYPDL